MTSSPVFTSVVKYLAGQKVLVLALLLYLPLIFWGYGSDVDTFRVLDAGRNFLETADYVPSRRPGYIVFEMSVFALDQAGGSLLVNLGTLFWALVAVACFQTICRRHKIANSGLLALIFTIHPLFWYNATVSIDYIWALGMLLAGFNWLEQERFGWSALAFGLAIGCRASSGIVAAVLLGCFWLKMPHQHSRLLIAGFITGLVGALAYVLPWDFAEWRSSFWNVSAGPLELWTPAMLVGRFIYKNLYFWGIPAALSLGVLLWAALRSFSKWKTPDSLFLVGVSSLVILINEVLFFRFPIAIEYLLPTLPFWLLIVGIGVQSKNLLRIFFVTVLLFNFINFNLARPDLPGQARSASIGLWVEPGYLLREMKVRLQLRSCDSRACYNEVIVQRPEIEEADH